MLLLKHNITMFAIICKYTNLNIGTGYDIAAQNNVIGWLIRRSIRKNLLSASVVGAFAPIGSEKCQNCSSFYLSYYKYVYHMVNIEMYVC